eukprot:TRINITY_DN1852_c0_g1_i2.p1 TRINITY_DN1852_c0_g1~~TRINITY_DN1852_c0_g1_i2.p1  ORF type:complete len:260 (-),score=46.24 TRINITY_DN1852_c0_g1_i2:126-863(-)
MEDQAETVSKSETTASVCTFIKPRKRKGMARKGSAVVDSDADLGVVKKMKEVKKVNLYTTVTKTVKDDFTIQSTKSADSEGSKDMGATAICDVDGAEEATQAKKFTKSDLNKRTTQSNVKGPVKGPANVRVTSVIDYQLPICKDWKETGYCGFGDNCKFVHDRSDHKAGYELDRDWNEGNYHNTMDSDDESSDEEVPITCPICESLFNNPVVTKCGHYFCMKCALDRHKKKPTCFECDTITNGGC